MMLHNIRRQIEIDRSAREDMSNLRKQRQTSKAYLRFYFFEKQ